MTMNSANSYVLCLTGGRSINKRMALFIEGVRASGIACRILALPRGIWRLDKSERPLELTQATRFSADVGSVADATVTSVLCFHWLVLPIAVLLGLWHRVPVLYDEHDHYELNTLEGNGGRLRRWCSGRLVHSIHRLCLPRVAVVTCIHMKAAVLRRHLERWQPNILEIHNYPARVWRESRSAKHDQGRLCFVYIGGVFAEKGPGAAADAFQLLSAADRANSELHIFGEGSPTLMRQLSLMPGVTVHNAVTPATFRQFASAHRCCGLALLASTPRYELVGTNCTKLYEYLALGMPVIATQVGEFPDFINRNHVGMLIHGQMNPIELAGAMKRLIRDEQLFATMADNAAALMGQDDMTWEFEWRKIEQTNVLASGRRAA